MELQKNFYKTGFIQASVIYFSTNDPLLTGPKDYRGNWRQIAVKLVVTSSSSQFNFFFFSNDDSSVEEATPISDRISVNEIRVRVSITNKFDFSVGDTWLRIKGNASSQRVKVGNSKRSEVLYIVKPNKVSENESDHNNGLIQIDGLNILWVNNVNLFTKFSTPIAFRYHERPPSVSIDELSSVHEMFAGDAALLRLVLHVGPVPLTSLMLLIDVDDQHLSTNRFFSHHRHHSRYCHHWQETSAGSSSSGQSNRWRKSQSTYSARRPFVASTLTGSSFRTHQQNAMEVSAMTRSIVIRATTTM